MAKLSIKAGATSVTANLFIASSASTTGAGLTGLVFNTSGLTAYYALPAAASAAITLVTLAAVTSAYSSGGFKEIDSTNMPGWYRFDIPNAAIASGRFSSIHFQGAASMAPLPLEIELTGWDNQDAVHGGMSALPNTACTTNASLLTSGSSTDQVSVSSGKVLLQATQSGVTIPTVTTVTNQLTAAQVATGVWQDATSGDFTTASSIGKSLYTSGVAPGGTNGLFIAGTNAATTVTTALTTTFTGNLTGSVGSVTGAVGSVTGAVGSVTGNVGGNVVGSVASVTARVTANSDQLAGQTITAAAGVTFPTSVASPTNITAGTITTVTNLTNAPSAGDFTAAMKTSLNAATPASVTGAVASVTGNVGGNVVGSVGSVVADCGITQAGADKVFGASGAALPELSGVPAATPSPASALTLIFMTLRNKLTTSATAKTVFNSAGTSITSKALGDDGTTYTESKMA